MTEQEINIVIAECCGWKFYCINANGEHVYHFHYPDGRIHVVSLEDGFPSYANNLNAMHEAEKTLPKDETSLRKWSDVLMRVIEDLDQEIAIQFYNSRVGLRYYSSRATARQRAEAFLRVKGLWK